MAERFLLDENIPASVLNLLKKKRFQVRTAVRIFGPGSSNGRIGEEAARSGDIVITLDSDFLKLHPNPKARIILVDVHPAIPVAIADVLDAHIEECVRLLKTPGIVRLTRQGPAHIRHS